MRPVITEVAARPARSQKRHRPAVAATRLTTAEKRGLARLAARAGLSTSDYLRDLILAELGMTGGLGAAGAESTPPG